MSSKPRARRNRAEKKFMQDEQDNKAEDTLDAPIEGKNKIQTKQEDFFDPHKLQPNRLLKQEEHHEHHVHHHYDQLEDNGLEETPSNIEKDHKEEQSSNAKKQRKRGRREVKKFDDEDEEEIKVQKSTNKAVFEQEDEQADVVQPKKEYPQTPQDSNSDEQARQAQKMKQMVSKKTLSSTSSYVHMHTILNKVGPNKQQRRHAIYTPLQPNHHSFVYFKRYQSGFSECYQAIGQDQRPIMFCQNQRGCIGCNYYISLTKEMDKSNPSYLGKLRGNAAGSVYQLYDNGMQPNNDYDRSKFRVSMGYIEYESNFLGMKGPRKLQVIVPKVSSYEDFDMFKFSEEESLGQFHGSNVLRLRNKSPKWNQRLKSYALNFGGRVKQASIKNFILIDDSFSIEQQEHAPNAMTFGKIDDNTFALQFCGPLSLYQAFGIAMSEFDFKLKCQ